MTGLAAGRGIATVVAPVVITAAIATVITATGAPVAAVVTATAEPNDNQQNDNPTAVAATETLIITHMRNLL